MTKNFRFIYIVMTFIFCFSAIAFGQETTGSIEGTIKDQNDAVVPGISVTVQSTGTTTGFNRTITTDDTGYFIVSSIPVGNYKVTVAEGKGFKGAEYDTTVTLGKSSQTNFKLEVGAGTTVVDVTSGETASIDTSESKLTTNITRQVIDALPKGTTFTTLLKTAPNVRSEALSGGFQVDGASGAENVFVIDGQEVTNFNTGTLNTNNNIPFELVQEVQIKSTGFEAEYGGATGGVINVVTMGGNNQWRGNAGISFVPGKLQGNARPFLNRFSNASNGFEYFQPNEIGGTNFFPVASLSGPVIKDKVWISGIYAPQFFESSVKVPYYINPTVTDALGRNVPSADPAIRRLASTLDYNYKFKVEEAFVRLDAQPTSKLRMYGTFLWNPIIEKGAPIADPYTVLIGGATIGAGSGLTNFSTVNPLGPLVASNDFLNAQGGRQNANNLNGQITYSATNNLILNLRAGRSFLNQKLGSYGIPNADRFVCLAGGNPEGVAGSGCVRNFTNFPTNFQNLFDVSYRNTVDADASLVGVNFGGRHNLKFGYQYNGISNEVDQGYRNNGITALTYGGSIAAVGITPTPGNLGYGYVQRFATQGKASSASQSFFAQDSWQIAKRLTLNLGFRAEVEDVPSFNEGDEGIHFGLGDKIAPRLGFALDVFGDGKTKVFGSYGWFYDRFKYQLPRGSFGGDFYRRDYFEILPGRGAFYGNYTTANVLGTTADIPGGNCPGGDTGVNAPLGNGWSVCQLDFRIPSNSGAGIDVGGAVDSDLKAARQSEYTFGVEHQLFNSLLFSARFTHKKIDRAVEDIGFPNAQGSEAYIIGNPGFGLACEVAQDNGFNCTKAQRDYKAFEFRMDKRLSNNWFVNASYTYSRLFGNYSGLASSDEAGRASPNVNRFFDLPFLGYTADGAPDNGLLATDRPHVFKAYGGYIYDWMGSKANSTDISFFTTIQSGTPVTTLWNFYNVASSNLNGRGDLGRTEMFTETDLSIKHTYKFGRDNRFSFQPYLNIRNLFDEQNELTRQNVINVTTLGAAQLVAGGCPATACTNEFTAIQQVFNGGIRQYVVNYLNANPVVRQRNDFNQANAFQIPREVRFGLRFMF